MLIVVVKVRHIEITIIFITAGEAISHTSRLVKHQDYIGGDILRNLGDDLRTGCIGLQSDGIGTVFVRIGVFCYHHTAVTISAARLVAGYGCAASGRAANRVEQGSDIGEVDSCINILKVAILFGGGDKLVYVLFKRGILLLGERIDKCAQLFVGEPFKQRVSLRKGRGCHKVIVQCGIIGSFHRGIGIGRSGSY